MTRLSWRLQSFRTIPINGGADLCRSRQHRLDRVGGAGEIPTQHQPVAIGPAHPFPSPAFWLGAPCRSICQNELQKGEHL
jgi:hypothetical protein